MRTPRGRVATANCYRHFGLAVPQGLEQFKSDADLFEDQNSVSAEDQIGRE